MCVCMYVCDHILSYLHEMKPNNQLNKSYCIPVFIYTTPAVNIANRHGLSSKTDLRMCLLQLKTLYLLFIIATQKTLVKNLEVC